MTRRLRYIVAGIIVGVVCAAGVAAYAYFTHGGTGTGGVTTGTLQPVTVAALAGGDSPSTMLIPGGSADVVLRIQNANAFPVTLVSVAGGPASITADAAHAACTNTGVTFANQPSLNTTVAASGTTFVDLPGAASMSTASMSACQGATFSIPVSITVHR